MGERRRRGDADDLGRADRAGRGGRRRGPGDLTAHRPREHGHRAAVRAGRRRRRRNLHVRRSARGDHAGADFCDELARGLAARAIIATAIFVGALLIGLVGATNFLPLYGRFNEILLYVMVPWTAVNLVDYYLVRHGDYDVASFFAADGVSMADTIWPLSSATCWDLVQVPFIASDVYTGPIARAMGGIDFSWIVGLVVVSAAYYGAMRPNGVSKHRYG